VKKSKDRHRTDRGELAKSRELRPTHPPGDAEDVEAANVRYLLHALNQMSLALQALGYVREGAAPVDVRTDLKNRLFHSSDKPEDSIRFPH